MAHQTKNGTYVQAESKEFMVKLNVILKGYRFMIGNIRLMVLFYAWFMLNTCCRRKQGT